MDELKILEGNDFGEMGARTFEDLVVSIFEKANQKVERQVFVNNRYDGRGGRVDLVVHFKEGSAGIEIDRKKPRQKSIFKLKELNVDRRFLILRSPFSIKEI